VLIFIQTQTLHLATRITRIHFQTVDRIMADISSIPQIAPFVPDADPTSVAQRWKRWSDRFDNLLVALNINDNNRKKALLLHLAGESVFDIFEGLILETIPDGANPAEINAYTVAKKALDDHFTPKKNIEFERYNFRSAKQQSDENLDTYHARLRALAKYCDFADVDSEIKSHIIQTCKSTRLRRRALTDTSFNLQTLIDLGRSMEISERQTKTIESSPIGAGADSRATSDKTVAHIRRKSYSQQKGSSTDRRQPSATCRNCGRSYPHEGGRTSCPAWGTSCRSCGLKNHWSQVCRKSQYQDQSATQNNHPTTATRGRGRGRRFQQPQHVRHVDNDQQSDGESKSDDNSSYVFSVGNVSASKQPTTQVDIQGTKIKFIIDSGASVNLIDEKQWSSMRNRPHLKQAKSKIFSYGSKTPMPILGMFDATVESNNRITVGTFYVTSGNGGSLLSYKSASELDLIKINVNSINAEKPITVDDLVKSHPELFNGIGKLKDFQVTLHIDKSVVPVAQPHRRIPFHIRQKVEKEIQSELAQDIIEPVTGPTEWVSPIVTPPKPHNPDEIRLCLDARVINSAIKRTRYVTPTLDDIIHDLNGATVFSKLDLKAGYKQLELAENCRYITTFSAGGHLYRYKRLVFGINSSAEIFQHVISQVLSDIDGVRNISDDILVYGRNQAEHDRRLLAVIQRLSERGLTLCRDKLELNKTSVKYYGQIFSAAGVSVDLARIKALEHMMQNPPQNATEARSLMGFLQYTGRNIHNLASLIEPIRRLTKSDTPWHWTEVEQQALNTLLGRLRENVTTAYFDPRRRSEVVLDGSPVGISAILYQQSAEGRMVPITFVSRALTPTESRYSQLEREALAAVWACERLHRFIFGSEFTLITDHKPLIVLLGQRNVKLSARMERWRLRLEPYAYRIIYRPGKDNPADWMSRHPINDTESNDRSQTVADEYINFIIDNTVPKSMTAEEIRAATDADETLQQVIKHVERGDWHKSTADDRMKPYLHLKDELNVQDGILLRGTRIVIPETLRDRTIKLAHEGHQGLVKSKMLLREKVWFPNIDKYCAEIISTCIECAATTTPNRANYEPLKMSQLPQFPWQQVSVDFLGPLPTGEMLMVVIDDYSRYPVVEIIHSTSANTVISTLDHVLSMFSIPEIVRSDNGPPFQSDLFRQYSQYMGFKHRRVTPLHPMANGEVERFMRSLEKCLRIAKIQCKNWKQEMQVFLRAYRTTPHCTTKRAPSDLLFNRQVRTRLPTYCQQQNNDNDVRERDKVGKDKMKRYADQRNHAKTSQLQVGDTVLVKQEKQNKLSSYYDPLPYKIKEIRGSLIKATRRNGQHSITRNSSFFKKLPPMSANDNEEDDSDSDDETTVAPPAEQRYNAVPVAAPIEPPVRQSPRRQNPQRNRLRPSRLNDYVVY